MSSLRYDLSLDALVWQAVREGRLSAAAGEAWMSTRGAGMAGWKDVMEARREASDALGSVRAYGRSIEDGRESDPALATLLAAEAICLEVRALSTVVDFVGGVHER